MLVRIYVGASWEAAVEKGDYDFDVLPSSGHKLAFATDAGWEVGLVRDVAHRITRSSEAADIALLLTRVTDEDAGDDPLPFAAFDRLDGKGTTGVASVPKTGSPWRGR
ncbi:hypothetical protein ASG67_16460 [Sphingomonas sp. Leaf339]|uniref:hypothetical protein n=1 Tax=Sphingomonas sp. Leaf339 TaxID=1736343 RepID=UPI0006FCE348|nr:hypothetical protein [Sphingomonas sp. Leaf339]KQU61590.1 hypothetical protein ASG67_16460 [Sphingomonas sp. Leaf339]